MNYVRRTKSFLPRGARKLPIPQPKVPTFDQRGRKVTNRTRCHEIWALREKWSFVHLLLRFFRLHFSPTQNPPPTTFDWWHQRERRLCRCCCYPMLTSTYRIILVRTCDSFYRFMPVQWKGKRKKCAVSYFRSVWPQSVVAFRTDSGSEKVVENCIRNFKLLQIYTFNSFEKHFLFLFHF